MPSPRKPQLLDLVAVLRSGDQTQVEMGDVGTVVQLLPPDGVEIEFLDRSGRTRCLATFQVDDVLLLNRHRTPVA
jgi:hypothetical protein